MAPTFYVLHGSDNLSIEETLEKLRREMGSSTEAEMNISEFNGEEATVPEVLGAVSSFPFLSDRRMIIVWGMLSWLTRKGAGQPGKDSIARLETDLPGLPDYARLIFVERDALTDKNPVVQLARSSDQGYEKRFEAPKDTTTWITKRAKSEYDTAIDGRAAAALAEVTGDDLRRADNELLKLANYVEPGATITEEDVAALTPYVPEASIFKMVDSIAEGRGQQALRLLHNLLSDKKQDVFQIYGMVVRQFRLILLTKEHKLAGQSKGELANVLGVKQPFVRDKLWTQADAFSLQDLERIYRQLHQYDYKMKTGEIEPHLALDLFVTSIAR